MTQLKVAAARERKTVTEIIQNLLDDYLRLRTGDVLMGGEQRISDTLVPSQVEPGWTPAPPVSTSPGIIEDDDFVEPPVLGCIDHRGDPEDWCPACLEAV